MKKDRPDTGDCAHLLQTLCSGEMEQKLATVKVQDSDAFTTVADYCESLERIYNHLENLEESLDSGDCKAILLAADKVGKMIVQKAGELIGYWTAKLEQSQRARRSVSARTRKRAENKDRINRLLSSKFMGEPTKGFIIAAMTLTQLGERTIKDMIKEIKEDTAE